MSYEAAKDDGTPEGVKMVMEMPDDTWLSIGFGDSMINTDMISWNARGENSATIDFYSTKRDFPVGDLQQDI